MDEDEEKSKREEEELCMCVLGGFWDTLLSS